MILFYISETFKSINRAKLAALITINTIALAILFSLFAIFALFYSSNLEEYVKGRVEIILFVQKGLDKASLNELTHKIKNDPYVARYRYVNERAAADEFLKKTGEDFSKLLSDNPLPSSYRIRIKKDYLQLNKIDQIKSRFVKLDGVTDVVFDYDFVLRLLRFMSSTKLLIYLLTAAFVMIAIYLVYSTNMYQIHSKMREYRIMKLVGATLFSIKFPIFLSGLILGLISSIICLILVAMLLYFINSIYYQIDLKSLLLVSTIVILLLGSFYGILGSYFSTKKISWKI